MRKLLYLLWFLGLFLSNNLNLWAQDSDEDIAGTFMLDSTTVQAVKVGLNPVFFIKATREDTTFFKAFKNLHFVPYQLEEQATIYNKKNKITAQKKETLEQYYQNKCRWQVLKTSEIKGKFYEKNGEHISETVQMFEKIFRNEDTVCNEKPYASGYKPGVKISKPNDIRQQRELVKNLVFAPQTVEIDVPFFRNKMKTNIYDEAISKYYQFSIRFMEWNGNSVYLFEAVADTIRFPDETKNLMIKKMQTYFRHYDLQVLGRSYLLEYPGTFVNCRVSMDIALQEWNDITIPASIAYEGRWKFPGKGTDIVKMKAEFEELK
jgi:hypothetical protein